MTHTIPYTNPFHRFLLPLPLALTLCVGACGSDSGQSTASLITASEGGTISLSDSTKITFPAGAVAEDVEMTMSVAAVSDFAALEDARKDVLQFDPEMVLENSAVIQWDLSDVDSTSRVHLMQFIDGVWLRPEVSGVEIGSGGIALASVYQLAPTALVVTEAATGASIQGSVVHIYTQDPLPGIEFQLWTSFEEMVGSTTSDASGAFSFANVAPGSYFVLAQVSSENNCFNDPTEKTLSAPQENGDKVAFAFVPGPCD